MRIMNTFLWNCRKFNFFFLCKACQSFFILIPYPKTPIIKIKNYTNARKLSSLNLNKYTAKIIKYCASYNLSIYNLANTSTSLFTRFLQKQNTKPKKTKTIIIIKKNIFNTNRVFFKKYKFSSLAPTINRF